MIASRRLGADEREALHACHEILAACGRDLSARFGLGHWDPPHPLEKFRDDARAREVHAVTVGERLVGTFTIGLSPIPAYPASYWSPVEPALYLNRLAVLPAEQRRGLGRACMALVEALAHARGARAVRLDAIAGHAPLLAFYMDLGYRDAGPFHIGCCAVTCFEKVLP
jgi:GNAT superfamily N-acetyltransferase